MTKFDLFSKITKAAELTKEHWDHEKIYLMHHNLYDIWFLEKISKDNNFIFPESPFFLDRLQYPVSLRPDKYLVYSCLDKKFVWLDFDGVESEISEEELEDESFLFGKLYLTDKFAKNSYMSLNYLLGHGILYDIPIDTSSIDRENISLDDKQSLYWLYQDLSSINGYKKFFFFNLVKEHSLESILFLKDVPTIFDIEMAQKLEKIGGQEVFVAILLFCSYLYSGDLADPFNEKCVYKFLYDALDKDMQEEQKDYVFNFARSVHDLVYFTKDDYLIKFMESYFPGSFSK